MKLIEGWAKIWWRRWSTWLAGFNAVLVAYVFSQPAIVIGLLGFAPGEWVVPLAALVALLAFVLPVWVAHIQQPKLEEKRHDKTG